MQGIVQGHELGLQRPSKGKNLRDTALETESQPLTTCSPLENCPLGILAYIMLLTSSWAFEIAWAV